MGFLVGMGWWGMAVLGYLLGSLPFGLWLVRATRGVDIRRYGSGNIGTTNVLRVAGPRVAALVLLADAAKGWLPVVLARAAGLGEPAAVLAGVAAMAGHSWSIWLGGKGGKGVATGLGVLLGLDPRVALAAFGVWIGVVALSRYSSLGSMSAAASVPLWMTLWHAPAAHLVFGVAAALVVLVRHRANIRRLLRGEELPITLKIDPRRE
ncbi:glycerol-3-phosphate 1-O-acyltransferase PlsY [Thermaerobacter sp. PB12/4term]|uniref:glycerol-3-phosphate 1-O-acyltransferase PlsY n=1 Tax=Thermaerobacter sp. PB12/4term TaxID=2293838 RepID=UPI000E32AD42|nr:glycerol-3-phosphate 1-O-acyltransferase PlsY [Thermaerobacter sp. PB12/4term]QIA27047.1 glycerol-3-phosphate 1-O-acyltransferase PlsY [Thermaerobacter sp. PB12/4term]